jgi:uncharacterized tellurite resistance protein B-like protein
MSLVPLTQPQREAIFELLLLGVYADSDIRLAENDRVYEMAASLGWEGPREPREYAQLATARARAAAENETATAIYLEQLAARITTDDAKKLALGMLVRLIEADDSAADSEAALFQKARAAFGV